jgi:hypothetical protein
VGDSSGQGTEIGSQQPRIIARRGAIGGRVTKGNSCGPRSPLFDRQPRQKLDLCPLQRSSGEKVGGSPTCLIQQRCPCSKPKSTEAKPGAPRESSVDNRSANSVSLGPRSATPRGPGLGIDGRIKGGGAITIHCGKTFFPDSATPISARPPLVEPTTRPSGPAKPPPAILGTKIATCRGCQRGVGSGCRKSCLLVPTPSRRRVRPASRTAACPAGPPLVSDKPRVAVTETRRKNKISRDWEQWTRNLHQTKDHCDVVPGSADGPSIIFNAGPTAPTISLALAIAACYANLFPGVGTSSCPWPSSFGGVTRAVLGRFPPQEALSLSTLAWEVESA